MYCARCSKSRPSVFIASSPVTRRALAARLCTWPSKPRAPGARRGVVTFTTAVDVLKVMPCFNPRSAGGQHEFQTVRVTAYSVPGAVSASHRAWRYAANRSAFGAVRQNLVLSWAGVARRAVSGHLDARHAGAARLPGGQ